jgi:hypothetical protein
MGPKRVQLVFKRTSPPVNTPSVRLFFVVFGALWHESQAPDNIAGPVRVVAGAF